MLSLNAPFGKQMLMFVSAVEVIFSPALPTTSVSPLGLDTTMICISAISSITTPAMLESDRPV